MQQLTVSNVSEWDLLLRRVALKEYEKITGIGAPFVLDPCLFFDGTASGYYDEFYHTVSRLATLDYLVETGHLLPDEAVQLHDGTFKGSHFPMYVDEGPFYRRHDHYHYTTIDMDTVSPDGFLDLLCQNDVYVQVKDATGFRMESLGPDHEVFDMADRLSGLLYAANMHLLTMYIPSEQNFACAWSTTTDIQKEFDFVCEGDGDAIEATYEVQRFRAEGYMFEGIPCYVHTQHAYKGGGFTCIS